MQEKIDVVDIKTLRKKYLKQKVSIDMFDKDVFVSFDLTTGEMFLEFTHLVSWTGDEYTYTITLLLSGDKIIQKISPLKCQRLAGDDAFSSTYKGKRPDEFDYYRVDRKLSAAVSFDK